MIFQMELYGLSKRRVMRPHDVAERRIFMHDADNPGKTAADNFRPNV